MIDDLNPKELGITKVGKFAQRLNKRKKELFIKIREVEENQERIRSLWKGEGLLSRHNLDEVSLPFEESKDFINKVMNYFFCSV